jgi:hypothetical protein
MFDKSGEIGGMSLIKVQGCSDVVEDFLQQTHGLIDELPLGRKDHDETRMGALAVR